MKLLGIISVGFLLNTLTTDQVFLQSSDTGKGIGVE
jgi:hypothetical protein